MKLSELLNNMLITAGVQSDDAELKKILALPALNQDDIPPTWEGLSNNILTVETAKYNPQIKSHFYGAALNPVEKELQNLMDAYEFGDEDKVEIQNVKSTFAKIPLLKEKLDNIVAKKAVSTGSDSKKYADQIQQLNAEILKIKNEAKKQIEEIENNRIDQIQQLYFDNILGSYNYTENLPKDVALISAKTLTSNYLKEKGGKIKLVDGKLELVNANDEALPYMENNQPVSIKNITDKIVAENKLLMINNQSANAQQQNQQFTQSTSQSNQSNLFLQKQLESIRKNNSFSV